MSPLAVESIFPVLKASSKRFHWAETGFVDRDDFVQEASVSLLRTAVSPQNPFFYAKASLNNAVATQGRKKLARPQGYIAVDGITDAIAPNVLPIDKGFEERLNAKLDVAKLLALLPPGQKEALENFYLFGEPDGDDSSLKVRRHRAIEKLRELLGIVVTKTKAAGEGR